MAGEFWRGDVVVDDRVEDALHGGDVVVDGDGGGGCVLSVPLSRASGPARSVPLGPPTPTAGRPHTCSLSYSRNHPRVAMWVGTVHAVHLFRRAHYYLGGRADDHGYAVATTSCGRLRRARDGACPLPPRVAVCQGEHFAQYCRGLPVAVHSVLTSPAEFARLTPAVLSLTGASNLANEFFGHHAHLAPLAIYPAAVLRRVECDPSGCAGHQGAPSAAPLSPPSLLATARSRPAIVPCVLRTADSASLQPASRIEFADPIATSWRQPVRFARLPSSRHS